MNFLIIYFSILLSFITNCSGISKTEPYPKNITSGHETINANEIETSDNITIKQSKIPGAGMGVFATKNIPKDAVIGEYKGKFISDEDYWKLVNANEWHYVMGLDECSYKFTNGIKYIDGRYGNFTTRINYAPAEFQNVKFRKVCEKPYVEVVSIKEIRKDDEIYVDYGPNYIYDFMEIPSVKEYFNSEKKKLKK